MESSKSSSKYGKKSKKSVNSKRHKSQHARGDSIHQVRFRGLNDEEDKNEE